MNFNARNPLIALSIESANKAIPREILVDYTKGEIYIKPDDENKELINITDTIREQLKDISSDIISVVYNEKKYSLTDFLYNLQKNLNLSINSEDTGESTVYFNKKERLDNASVESVYKKIQLKGFKDAENLSILQKRDGIAQWVSPDGIIIDDNPNNGDSTESTKVEKIEPVNGAIYLKAIKRQITTNLRVNAEVIVPKVLDEYSEICWMVRTYTVQPILKFAENIFFHVDGETISPGQNMFTLYRFVTYDAGNNWFGERIGYTKIGSTSNSEITKEYLNQNYVSKIKLESEYLSIEQMRDEYLNENQIGEKFPSKIYLENNYYDKDEVDDKFKWITE